MSTPTGTPADGFEHAEVPARPALRVVRLRGDGPRSPMSRRVEDATSAREFCELLDELRKWAGVSFMAVQLKTEKKISKTRAHLIVHASELPSAADLDLLLSAFDVSETESGLWHDASYRIANGLPVDEQPLISEPPPPREQSLLPTATVAPPAPATEPQSTAVPAPRVVVEAAPVPAGPQVPMTVTVRAMLAVTAIVLILAGTTTGMWMLHVPVEVILAMLALAGMCVTAWLMALRWRYNEVHAQAHRYRPDYLVEPDPSGVFGTTGATYTPNRSPRRGHRPEYLVEPDPEGLFGTDARTVNPTIGL